MIEWVGQAPASAVDVVDGVQVINKQTAKSFLLMLGQLYPIVTPPEKPPPEKPPGPKYVKAVTCEEFKQATNLTCSASAYDLVVAEASGSVVMVNLADGSYRAIQLVILPPDLQNAASQFAGPGSELGVLKVEQAIGGVSSKRKRDTVAAAVIGAVTGGALGFALGGPLGAAAGGSGGINFANWLVS